MSKKLNDLIAKAKKLPPMTKRQRDERDMDFAYGNFACSSNHKPQRLAFRQVAQSRGWTQEEFDKWAEDKVWTR